MVLNSDTEEHLLRDIERKGLPLEQVSLLDICDANIAVYGRSGQPRREVQQRWGKIKKLQPCSYLALLKKHKIPPSPATLGAVEEARKSKEKEPTETIEDIEETSIDDDEESKNSEPTEPLDDDKESIISNDDDSIIDDSNEPTTNEEPTTNDSISNIVSALESLSIKPIKPAAMFTTPTRTPMKKLPFLPSRMTSPTPSTVDFAETATEEEDVIEDSVADLIVDFRNQNGTKNRPYITLVDWSHPEKNGHVDITCFEELEHNDRDRNGFHIRRSIDPQDMDAWNAFIPNDIDFPRLAPLTGRVLFIKGPSRSYGIRDFKRYHNGRKPIACKVTAKFHEKSDTAIASDSNRKISYFLLVFPPGTVLDNYCFSGDHFVVQKHKNPYKQAATDTANAFKKDVLGMTLWWRIAVAGGTLIRQAKVVEDPADMFA
jgi:hypothetical protein